MSIDTDEALKHFRTEYGVAPSLVTRAPGRVNIIGEHTDYNHGFVLPMAIERETVIAARPRDDRRLRVYAVNMDRRASADLTNCTRNDEDPWLDYLVGVAYELAKLRLPVHGADLVVLGDVPIGAGLSSSASLEMAALMLFECLGEFQMSGPEAARLGRRVENEFLGVNSGIMDQFIARMGKSGCALFLDCRTCRYEHVPAAFAHAVFVIADSSVRRGLAGSKYNERVRECEEAVQAMRECLGKTGSHLRDFDLDDLEAAKGRLSQAVYRRARHVVTENDRTKAACEALRSGDADVLGALMTQSDASLRCDYEVTCPELDALTAIARSAPGCYGARMTGAGFGGCTVNLVAADAIGDFTDALSKAYRKQTGLNTNVVVSRPAAGASFQYV